MRLVIALLLSILLSSVASAETRMALLIGNQGYSAKVGPLKNPHSDIVLVGAALRAVGFTVTEVKDADYRSTDAAIKRHIAMVRKEGQGAISFVYYSGHGAADAGTKINYLIPVDVANADDEELWNYSINLNTLVENLRAQAPGATHYVVFDACRNELNLTRRGQKALSEKGFVPMAYTPGVMVAYATAPGGTASDIGTAGGTYAKALADEIVKPGIDSMLVFTRVARRVQHEIGQDPFLSASTMPEIYFAGAAPVATTQPNKSELERAWEFIKETDDQARLEAFIKQFGDTPYAPMARSRLEDLRQRQTASGPTKSASIEPSRDRSPSSVDAVREALYRSIINYARTHRITNGPNAGAIFFETYQRYDYPKAMSVCIDMNPEVLERNYSGQMSMHIISGKNSCRGLSAGECGRRARERCEEKSSCVAKRHKCLVVDVNGRNAVEIDQTAFKQLMR
jgi:Caspase domain